MYSCRGKNRKRKREQEREVNWQWYFIQTSTSITNVWNHSNIHLCTSKSTDISRASHSGYFHEAAFTISTLDLDPFKSRIPEDFQQIYNRKQVVCVDFLGKKLTNNKKIPPHSKTPTKTYLHCCINFNKNIIRSSRSMLCGEFLSYRYIHGSYYGQTPRVQDQIFSI